jgi:hypothetical protein
VGSFVVTHDEFIAAELRRADLDFWRWWYGIPIEATKPDPCSPTTWDATFAAAFEFPRLDIYGNASPLAICIADSTC